MRLAIPVGSLLALLVGGCGTHDHGAASDAAGAGIAATTCEQASDHGVASDPGDGTDPGVAGGSRGGSITGCVVGANSCGAGWTCMGDALGKAGVCRQSCSQIAPCPADSDCVTGGQCAPRCSTVDDCPKACGVIVGCTALSTSRGDLPPDEQKHCAYSLPGSVSQPGG